MSADKHLGRIEGWLRAYGEPIGRLARSLLMHDNKPIFVANALMICIWIAGIIGMPYMYATIEIRYKADPNSGSNLFKIIYALCHWVISIILFMYVYLNTFHFSEETTTNIPDKPVNKVVFGGDISVPNIFKFIISS